MGDIETVHFRDWEQTLFPKNGTFVWFSGILRDRGLKVSIVFSFRLKHNLSKFQYIYRGLEETG